MGCNEKRQLQKKWTARLSASANENEWEVIVLMSVLSRRSPSSCYYPSPGVLKSPSHHTSLFSLYHFPQTQEGATHPRYNLSTSRHNSGASSPGMLKKHLCVMGDPSSLTLPSICCIFPFYPLAHNEKATMFACIWWNRSLNCTINPRYLLFVRVIHISTESSKYRSRCGVGSMACHTVDLCWEGMPPWCGRQNCMHS